MNFRNLTAGVIAMLLAASAQADTLCERLQQRPASRHVFAGLEERVEYPLDIRRVAIGNPDVADVELVNQREILLTAKRPGVTGLKVWTRCPQPEEVVVLVASAATLEANGGRAATRPAQLTPQVQTDIRVLEVSRRKLKEAGNSLFLRNNNSRLMLGAPSVIGSVTAGLDGVTDLAASVTGENFNIVYGAGSRNVLGVLSLLEQSGYASTLAEPSLVALSGQNATFLAGGEFPVPVRGGVDNSVSVQYKEFGVRLALTPTVLDDQRIALKVSPEVSDLDWNAGVESGGVQVPALRVRRTDTSIVLADGESFVISGLISASSNSQVNKFPGLGSLPVIGALFRASNLESEDRELIMVVTPRLVRPLAADAELPALPGERLRRYRPDFLEFFLRESGEFDARRSATQQGFSH